MANLQFSKANRTKVIKSFPTKEMGKEGDIVISGIPGKGYYLCAKVGNRWYAADKLNELKRLKTPRLQDLQVDSLKVKNLKIEKKATGGEISVSKGNLILDVEGDLNFYNSDSLSVDILQSDVNSGQINLYETKGTGTQHYIGLKADATMAASTVYTLPNIFPSGSSKVLQSTTAGILSWVSDTNTITALNNATENELVTVGATTTELDAEANLTFDGTDLAIATTGKIYFDGGGSTYISETSDGNVRVVVCGDTIVDFNDATLGNTVFIRAANLNLAQGKAVKFDGLHTYIVESSDDVLDFYVGGDNMLKLDEANDKITMGATNWVAGTVSGATVTEFSVANSAYAGMILGYRLIGEDVGHSSYTMTTSFAVPNSAMTVRFVAPPSGAVEVMVQVYVNSSGSNKFKYFGLSDNATYNTIGVQYEQVVRYDDETDDGVTQLFWGITGLTAGDTYNYWLGVKTSGTNAYINWGGDSSGRYIDFIMKATALPTAVSDFAVYD